MKGVIIAVLVAALIVAGTIVGVAVATAHRIPKPALEDEIYCATVGGNLHYEDGLGWRCEE